MNIYKKSLLALSIMASPIFSTYVSALDYPTKLQIDKMESSSPKLIKNLTSKSEDRHVLNIFDAGNNIKGYVIGDDSGGKIFYQVGNSDVFFVGTMVNSDMVDVTSEHYAKQIPQKDQSKVFEKIKASNSYFTEGSDKSNKEIFVFFDPNCGYCKQLWANLRPIVNSGTLKVHWMPVAILGDSSKNLSATILQSNSPAETMSDLEKGHIEGLPENEIKSSTIDVLNKNVNFMKDLKATGTPTIVYKTKDNKSYSISSSMSTEDLLKLSIDIKDIK